MLFFLGGLAGVQSGPQFYKYIVGAFALSHPNISFLPLGDFVLIKEKIASPMFCFIAICISIVYPVTSAFSIIVSELLP